MAEVAVRGYSLSDMPQMLAIWNDIVEEGIAFPQMETLTPQSGAEFFGQQSFTAVACKGDDLLGLYILHPNNVGRCGHICNASYAVARQARGQGVGEALVRHCIGKARECGFGILQFNAVVATNAAALSLYEKLGFVQLGVIPGGFLLRDGRYEDIIPHYLVL